MISKFGLTLHPKVYEQDRSRREHPAGRSALPSASTLTKKAARLRRLSHNVNFLRGFLQFRYNQLLRIEEELGSLASFVGSWEKTINFPISVPCIHLPIHLMLRLAQASGIQSDWLTFQTAFDALDTYRTENIEISTVLNSWFSPYVFRMNYGF